MADTGYRVGFTHMQYKLCYFTALQIMYLSQATQNINFYAIINN